MNSVGNILANGPVHCSPFCFISPVPPLKATGGFLNLSVRNLFRGQMWICEQISQEFADTIVDKERRFAHETHTLNISGTNRSPRNHKMLF